eukprot:COSAG01_NODE_2917_length_6859_cov_3.995414_2_plen_95_part_00
MGDLVGRPDRARPADKKVRYELVPWLGANVLDRKLLDYRENNVRCSHCNRHTGVVIVTAIITTAVNTICNAIRDAVRNAIRNAIYFCNAICNVI